MTTSSQDNSSALDPISGGPESLVTDLQRRYDELLEFLLEFTHRQAQWDQRQEQLVDFQRRAVEQLRNTSFELVDRHEQLQATRQRLAHTTGELANHTHGSGHSQSLHGLPDELSLSQLPKDLREKTARLDEYEEELKQRIFEQKQLTQLTRLQRRKIAQQIRAQRAEIQRLSNRPAQEPTTSSPSIDLTPILEQFKQDLNHERSNSQKGVEALQETLAVSQAEKDNLRKELKERINDIDELKRIIVENQRVIKEKHEGVSESDSQAFEELEQHRRELREKEQTLKRFEEKTRLQREKIAQQIRAQRAELQKERIAREVNSEHAQEVVESMRVAETLHEIREAILSRLDQQQSFLDDRIEQLKSEAVEDDAIEIELEEEPTPTSHFDEEAAAEHRAEIEKLLREQQRVWEQLRDQLADQFVEQHREIRAQIQKLDQPGEAQSPDWLESFRDDLLKQQSESQQSLVSLEQRISSLSELPIGEPSAATESKDFSGEVEKLQRQLDDSKVEANRLMDENADLAAQLKEARDAMRSGEFEPDLREPRGADVLGEELERLQKDLEQAKTQNRKLKKQLTEAQEKANAIAPSGDGNDWESAKQRLLAELEAFDENDEKQQGERISIEEVVRETDRIISEKDEEIAELKHLLSHQSESIGDMAVGANAIAEMMDNDELIQQERENLSKLQEEWKEKLRKSEVELSLERARLARERAELEERLAQIKIDEVESESSGESGKSGSSRGKWLERLGLRDEADKE